MPQVKQSPRKATPTPPLTVAELKSGDTLKLYDGRKNGVGEGLAEVVGIFPMAILVGIQDSRCSAAYFNAELKRYKTRFA
jgi:hypothetical protein